MTDSPATARVTLAAAGDSLYALLCRDVEVPPTVLSRPSRPQRRRAVDAVDVGGRPAELDRAAAARCSREISAAHSDRSNLIVICDTDRSQLPTYD